MLRWIAALVFAALLISNPADALDAARQAIAAWGTSFVPALLPFFAVTPALSSDEAARLYRRLFGRAFEALFGCPGTLAGAALIGMMAGSPAGSIAAGRLRGGAARAELTRGALLASGVSPGFLISAVGTAMLGDPALGAVLLRAMLGALLIGGLILRRAFSGGPPPAGGRLPAGGPPPAGGAKRAGGAHPVSGPRPAGGPPAGGPPPAGGLPPAGGPPPAGDPPPAGGPLPAREGALMGAALSMLGVCAHMVVFAVAARLIARMLPAGFEPWVLSAMEVSGGCAAVAQAAVAPDVKLILLAFACGFGGFAILAQNFKRLRGVRLSDYLAGKLLHGSLAALLCWAQLGFSLPARPPLPAGLSLPAFSALPQSWSAPVALACALVLLTAAGVFLTKRAWYNGAGQKKG